MSEILVLRKQRQENHKFRASLDYVTRPCLKKVFLDVHVGWYFKPRKEQYIISQWYSYNDPIFEILVYSKVFGEK